MTIPEFQIARARAMLATVKAETGFGPDMPPLPFVRAVAERLVYPWGLNGKRGRADDISKDILAYDVPGQQPILVDVLIDGGGQNGLTFDIKGWPEPAGAVFIPVGPVTLPWPSLLPEPAPVVDLVAQLARIEADIQAIRQDQREEHNAILAIAAVIGVLSDDVDKLKQQPVRWPTYTGAVAIRYLGNVPIRLEPKS